MQRGKTTAVQFSCSVVSDSVTQWTEAHQASLSITNSWNLLKLMSIESVMPSNHLSSPSSPAFNLSQHQVFSKESVLHIRWPKYWIFSFSISPSSEYSGMIAFESESESHPLGLTVLISLLSKGLSRVFSRTTVWKHQFFDTLASLWSYCHIHTWPMERP